MPAQYGQTPAPASVKIEQSGPTEDVEMNDTNDSTSCVGKVVEDENKEKTIEHTNVSLNSESVASNSDASNQHAVEKYRPPNQMKQPTCCNSTMPPRRSTHHVNNAAPPPPPPPSTDNATLIATITDAVIAAMAQMSNNGSGRGVNISTNGQRQGRSGDCTFKDFTNSKPISFNGSGGIMALSQWIEKTEAVFEICAYLEVSKVKFAACMMAGFHLLGAPYFPNQGNVGWIVEDQEEDSEEETMEDEEPIEDVEPMEEEESVDSEEEEDLDGTDSEPEKMPPHRNHRRGGAAGAAPPPPPPPQFDPVMF
ncbi:hypothetical protein Lser_V15G05957 [Lactuca serriola]